MIPSAGPRRGVPCSDTEGAVRRPDGTQACAVRIPSAQEQPGTDLRGAFVTNPDSRIHIIGVGSDGLAGLTSRARDILLKAEVVLGPEAVLAQLPELKAERRPIGTDLQETTGQLQAIAGKKRIAVVAGGDPLFYGVARYLCDRMGKEAFEVLPHVSSMQLAFARVKETWEEAFLTNLATHPLDTVLDRIRIAEKVGLFTSEAEGPSAIAR